MGYNTSNKSSRELWAIVDSDGNVMWSRGGSSTSPKLMIYESEKKAEAALKNKWTKQIIKESEVEIKKIYSARLSSVDLKNLQQLEEKIYGYGLDGGILTSDAIDALRAKEKDLDVYDENATSPRWVK